MVHSVSMHHDPYCIKYLLVQRSPLAWLNDYCIVASRWLRMGKWRPKFILYVRGIRVPISVISGADSSRHPELRCGRPRVQLVASSLGGLHWFVVGLCHQTPTLRFGMQQVDVWLQNSFVLFLVRCRRLPPVPNLSSFTPTCPCRLFPS